MRLKTSFSNRLLMFLLLSGLIQTTQADPPYFLNLLYGHWRDPLTGDSYSFDRDQTYIFRAGEQERRSGNLSHSGTWSTYYLVPSNPLPLEAMPHGLELTATKRQTLSRGRVQNRPAQRVFKLTYQRIKLNPPPGVAVYPSRGGYYYYREPNNPQNVHRLGLTSANNPNRLFIGKTAFVRVK